MKKKNDIDVLATFKIPKAMLEEIKIEAKKIDLTFSQLIRSLLRDFLKRSTKK